MSHITRKKLSVKSAFQCTCPAPYWGHMSNTLVEVSSWPTAYVTALDMTPLGWLGRKTSTQTNTAYVSKQHGIWWDCRCAGSSLTFAVCIMAFLPWLWLFYLVSYLTNKQTFIIFHHYHHFSWSFWTTYL